MMYPISYMFGLYDFRDGAWYEPTPDEKVQHMMQLLDVKPGHRAVDLGSGDGRIVIAMAKRGAYAVGFEKDEKLVKKANENIKTAGLSKRAKIIHANFWKEDLSRFDRVSVYQMKSIMKKLEQKLQKELPIGALAVSNYWQFPTWKALNHDEDLWLYVKEHANRKT